MFPRMFKCTFILILFWPAAVAAQSETLEPQDSLIISSPAILMDFGVEKPEPPPPAPDLPEGILDSVAGTVPATVFRNAKNHAMMINFRFPDTTDARLPNIRSLILSKKDVYFFCYNMVQKKYPGVQGFLRLNVWISHPGRVEKTTILTDTFPTPEVGKCIRARTKTLKFQSNDAREELLPITLLIWLGPAETGAAIPRE